MKTLRKLTSRLAVLGVLSLLGSQAQAGWLPACTQAEVDLEAEELRVDGRFRWCPRPSVWLGQADGGYEDLGTPLDWSDEFVLADLMGATVVEGARQKVVVKCGWKPRCEIDVAFAELGECEDCSGAPVAKTGQTTSYDTGDDGDLEKGAAWPAPRFTDNTDGTVTDNLTGLMWLKNANCFGTRNWAAALSDANTLNDGECDLTDGSAEGDWRLPNIKELHSLVDFGRSDPALPSGHPFSGVRSGRYWSSTSYAGNSSYAWFLSLYLGDVYAVLNSDRYYVWPVRGGH
ncbi:MAG: DUF1566 domain-containing protein [Halieaceae bacterium]|jgi:hypothetical protein|nr:DUF1566 domain-containing protein [Halieaceae bacterium]